MYNENQDPNFEIIDKMSKRIFKAIDQKPPYEIYLCFLYVLTYVIAKTSEDGKIEERAKAFCDELMVSVKSGELLLKRFDKGAKPFN